jgi:hypothetical protein
LSECMGASDYNDHDDKNDDIVGLWWQEEQIMLLNLRVATLREQDISK